MCKRFRNVLLAHSSFLLICHLYVFADGADCICDQEQHLVISGCCYRNKIWIIMWVFFVYFLLFFLFFFLSWVAAKSFKMYLYAAWQGGTV